MPVYLHLYRNPLLSNWTLCELYCVELYVKLSSIVKYTSAELTSEQKEK